MTFTTNMLVLVYPIYAPLLELFSANVGEVLLGTTNLSCNFDISSELLALGVPTQAPFSFNLAFGVPDAAACAAVATLGEDDLDEPDVLDVKDDIPWTL